MQPFVHLHLHTQYSLLDGFCRIPSLMERVKSLGMTAVAMTDHGNMYGAIQFYKEAKKQGIKPIIGSEVYVCDNHLDRSSRTRYHLVLLAENEVGYHNLMRVVSEGFVNGFYYKPRVDKEVLKKYSEGLICLSACLAGELARSAVAAPYERTKALALEYDDIFGRENFFLEIQNHGIPEEKIVADLFQKIHEETGIPLVATNDAHYIYRDDAKAHDILMCIQTGTTVQEEKRLEFPSDNFYVKSQSEMQELLGEYPGAIENTVRIADRCQVDFTFHQLHLPYFAVPSGFTNTEYLRKLVEEGIQWRYGNIEKGSRLAEARERAAYELSVIDSMGYVDYFLIVSDFVHFAMKEDIPVGPGRGSAAGSIISYALGITGIDPLEYDLLFERFLNPERVSMPDIDIDFCYERREEVIDYVKQKYGSDRVAQIVTFGTMAAKNSIRDVGRALDIPLSKVDQVAKAVPSALNMTLERALKESAELRKIVNGSEENQELVKYAMEVEGMPRHTSTHAAGVLIAGEPVDHLVPLSRNGEQITTQYNMTELEELGLLKMDFLGLRNLTVIHDAVKMIGENHGIQLDMDKIDVNDPGAMQLFHTADTIGIFQFESGGMRSFLKELKPDRFDDLVAANALFRPGPMDQIPTYIKARHNPELVSYLHPLLEPILKSTYGVIVYQEQVMQIVQQLAGYSLGGADNLRRAMSKKKMSVMQENRTYFVYGKKEPDGTTSITGCLAKGIPESVANQIYDQMIEFAKYAFNKSHSVAYAYVAMQTAILKKYYPCEYFAALLSSIMDSASKISLYTQEAKRCQISILRPSVNASRGKFSVEDGKIRFGLLAIKNVGTGIVNATVEARKKGPFKDLEDYLQRILEVDNTALNRKAVESLIKAGAFDDFSLPRAQMMMDMEMSLESVQHTKRNNLKGQTSMFDLLGAEAPTHKKVMREYRKSQFLAYEKEVLGIYLTDHPFSPYEGRFQPFTDFSIENILAEEDLSHLDDQTVRMAGLICGKKDMQTKKKQQMCFLTLEDRFGVIEVVVFPKVWEQYAGAIQVDAPVLISGKLQVSQDDQVKLIANTVLSMEQLPKSTLYLQFVSFDRSLYECVKTIFLKHKGELPVVLYFSDKKRSFAMDPAFFVDGSENLVQELVKILGIENVKLQETW